MDELRTTMQQFVQTASFTGEDKLMILDEGDNLSQRMMGALRGFIEEYSAGCSFIITVNNPSKLDEAILSRCPPVDFSIPKEEEGTIMLAQFQMIKRIFEAEGIAAKNVDIAQTIKRIFPDLRKAMNLIQRACETGTFNPSSILGSMDSGMDTLYDALASKAYVKILTWVDSNQPIANSKDVYRGIYDMYRNKVDPEVLATAVLTIEEYMDKATRSINPQITLLGCLSRLIREAPIA
jgi:DNA polymerase III delta prime subunit